MNGFIFKVSDLCHDEKGTFFRGKYFGGKVRSKEKILLSICLLEIKDLTEL